MWSWICASHSQVGIHIIKIHDLQQFVIWKVSLSLQEVAGLNFHKVVVNTDVLLNWCFHSTEFFHLVSQFVAFTFQMFAAKTFSNVMTCGGNNFWHLKSTCKVKEQINTKIQWKGKKKKTFWLPMQPSELLTAWPPYQVWSLHLNNGKRKDQKG